MTDQPRQPKAAAMIIGHSLDEANKTLKSNPSAMQALRDGKLKFVVKQIDGEPVFFAIGKTSPMFDTDESHLTPSQALAHAPGIQETTALSPMDRMLDRADIGTNMTHRQRDPLRKEVHSKAADIARDAVDFAGSYVGPAVAGAMMKSVPGAAAVGALGGLGSGVGNIVGAHAADEPDEAKSIPSVLGTAAGAAAGAAWNKHFSPDNTVRRHAKKYVEERKLKGNRVDDELLERTLDGLKYGMQPTDLPTIAEWTKFPLEDFDRREGDIPMRLEPLPAPRRLPEGYVPYDASGNPVPMKKFIYQDREPRIVAPTRKSGGNVGYDVPDDYVASTDVDYESFPKIARSEIADITDAELDGWLMKARMKPNADNRAAVRKFLIESYGDNWSTYGKDFFPDEQTGITSHKKSELVPKWTGSYKDDTKDQFAKRMYRQQAHAEDPRIDKKLTAAKKEYKRRHAAATAGKKNPLVSPKEYEDFKNLKVPGTSNKFVGGRPFVRAAGTFLLPMLVNGAQGYIGKWLAGED